MKLDLTGKNAVVTGASSGLGRHFAHVLAGAGARPGLLARREDRLRDLAAQLEKSHGISVPLAVCDITDGSAVTAALKRLHGELGGIDVLINNAGTASQAPALETEPADWDRVMDTNLRGPWLASTEAARLMIADGTPGSIINIASILGLRTGGQLVPYAVSKAGLVHMTRLLALEWARYNIRVNALAPGYFATDMNVDFFESEAGRAMLKRVPQRRLGELPELNGPLLLLASEASNFMTGAVIPVDGGHLVGAL